MSNTASRSEAAAVPPEVPAVVRRLDRLKSGGELLTIDDAQRERIGDSFVELSEGFCHYRLSGPEDGPLVVLVHGYSGPMGVWRNIVPALIAARFRVLSYDLFGRGWSDRPNGRYGQDRFDKQLTELLDALNMTRPILLCGWSMGGLISAEFTARHADRVRKLALLAPAGLKGVLHWTARAANVPVIGELSMNLYGHQVLCNGDGFFDSEKAKPYVEMVAEQMHWRGYRRAALSTLRNMPLADASDTYRRLAEQAPEALVIWGAADEVLAPSGARQLHAYLPDVEVQLLPRSGHVLQFEAADAVNENLVEFFTDRTDSE